MDKYRYLFSTEKCIKGKIDNHCDWMDICEGKEAIFKGNSKNAKIDRYTVLKKWCKKVEATK
jgi:hypothetical protein